MFQITDPAASLLDEVRSVRRIPDHYGVRVYGGATSNGQRAIQVKFSEEPLTGDEVTEAHGTRLFVAPEIGEISADLVLDVDQRESGAQLVLREA